MTKHIPFILCLGLTPLLGQTPAEEPTPEQLLAIAEASVKLPARGAWRITFSRVAPPEKSANPAFLASSLEASRVGGVQRDLITWPDKKISEAWWLGKAWLAEDPNVAGVLFNVIRWPGRVGLAGWIGRDSLKGIRDFNGKKCIVFEADLPLVVFWPGYVIPDPNRSARLKAEAFISLDEGKLLRVQLGEVNADFTWLTPPDGELVVTPRFAKRYLAIQKALGPELKGAGN